MLAYYAFTGAHLVMIVGVILVAAGITDAIHHFDGHAHRWWPGCGTAVFLLGHAACGRVCLLDALTPL
ncbi:hypothetical protein [Streptomyces sp. NPDC127197]|uniref:hypothetical protein n=1 Tax=Streptomyces sp. NPDC127197 TaxID=3345388 RepID=UPI00363BF745